MYIIIGPYEYVLFLKNNFVSIFIFSILFQWLNYFLLIQSLFN